MVNQAAFNVKGEPGGKITASEDFRTEIEDASAEVSEAEGSRVVRRVLEILIAVVEKNKQDDQTL
jgi:hypothetical protein